MTITWKITQCDRLTSDGFITTAHWTVSAVDGDYFASICNTSSFAEGTPTIPYNDVTEQDVLQWIWENGVDKQAAEDAVSQMIELQKNPVQASGLPW
jgi:hypothetical protein